MIRKFFGHSRRWGMGCVATFGIRWLFFIEEKGGLLVWPEGLDLASGCARGAQDRERIVLLFETWIGIGRPLLVRAVLLADYMAQFSFRAQFLFLLLNLFLFRCLNYLVHSFCQRLPQSPAVTLNLLSCRVFRGGTIIWARRSQLCQALVRFRWECALAKLRWLGVLMRFIWLCTWVSLLRFHFFRQLDDQIVNVECELDNIILCQLVVSIFQVAYCLFRGRYRL